MPVVERWMWNPGKSFLAIWGGYYGQALRLLDGDGNEQALPEKPALLDSAVPDEAAEAAEQAQQHAPGPLRMPRTS